MSYNFQPLTDEELDAINIVDEGVYNFEVVKSTKKVSKSGNNMAELELRFWDKEGVVKFVYDYLVFSTIALNIRKVKHFCDSVGLVEEYKQGNIPEELTNRSGKLLLGIQEERPNPSGGVYPKKNTVVDYVLCDKGAVKHPGADDGFNDELPF